MPALITHQIIAEKTAKLFSQDTIKDLPHFYLGAQGGDIFYTYKYLTLKKRVNFGIALHRNDIYKTFENFRKYLQNSTDFAAFSYVLGYITHYAGDITFHPFVYYLINMHERLQSDDAVRANDKIHYLIESDIDVFLLQTEKGEGEDYVYPLSQKQINTNSLYALYQKIYFDLCGEELSENSFKRAIKRFFLLNRLLSDKKQRKRQMIFNLESFLNTAHIVSYLFRREKPSDSYINIENQIWHSLDSPNDLKTCSATDLLEQSVQLSNELIIDFLIALKTNSPLPIHKFSTDLNNGSR